MDNLPYKYCTPRDYLSGTLIVKKLLVKTLEILFTVVLPLEVRYTFVERSLLL